MHHHLYRYHGSTFTWHAAWHELVVALCLVVLIVVSPAGAAMRFQDRSLFIGNNEPGVTSAYTLTFRYMSTLDVGSVDLLFCHSPIPYDPCVAPSGLDVSRATLKSQSGETGFSVAPKSPNRLTLTRSSTMVTASSPSTYVFEGIVNPSDASRFFAIRLASYASSDASGPEIDFGSVMGQVSKGIVIETQVTSMLVFCVAEEVSENCESTNRTYYRDMGQLSPDDTLTAQSQMAVGTNASGGFVITANGSPLSSGQNVIDGLSRPTPSQQGTNQFGINLVANNAPSVGSDPEGTWANAVASSDYGLTNHYKYQSGDTVAFSPNVSLMKKFTVSYIVNSDPNLRAGVYSTTINFVASGRF